MTVGGERRRHWEVAALVLAVSGCITRVSVPPMPCDTIDQRPGLREELRLLRALPGDPFLYTRWYAIDASEACAGNHELGAPRITPEEPKASWWERFGAWVRSLF